MGAEVDRRPVNGPINRLQRTQAFQLRRDRRIQDRKLPTRRSGPILHQQEGGHAVRNHATHHVACVIAIRKYFRIRDEVVVGRLIVLTHHIECGHLSTEYTDCSILCRIVVKARCHEVRLPRNDIKSQYPLVGVQAPRI